RSRTARTTELIGFQSATGRNQPGKVSVRTNALDRKVTGNIQMNPADWATSTLRTDSPITADTQLIAYPNNRRTTNPAAASMGPVRIRQPTINPQITMMTTTSTLLSRSDVVRPIRTAARDIGRERNRST